MILLIRRRSVRLAALFCCATALLGILSRQAAVPAMADGERPCRTVVIDPGHGGQDGGAVSADGTAESGINLAVSQRLEGLLRLAGIPTAMTRRSDEMVCDPGLDTMRQRKVSDIRNRVTQVNAIPNAVLLSIHQNSLPSSPETHGAQAFWNGEAGADVLAGILQADLNTVVNTHRAKEAKPISGDIYLMRHVTAPAVLVECGFLSNGDETARLRQEDYQTTLAAVIAAGYLRWAAENG